MPFDQEEMVFLKELSISEINVFQEGFAELKKAIDDLTGILASNCTPGCNGGCLQTCFNCASGGSLPKV